MMVNDKTNDERDVPVYLFHQGTNFTAYELMGVHITHEEEEFVHTFRVWAPRADEVRVTGDFCSWGDGVSMTRISPSGIWEGHIVCETSLAGTFYKYAIRRGERLFLKADPYAQCQETREKSASVIWEKTKYAWGDGEYLKKRRKTMGRRSGKAHAHFCPVPMNIYELHLGSWHTLNDAQTSDGEHYLSYRVIADRLAVYLKEMGYTHVELLPIMEHPYDGSWGYQICGYYAPTGRFGNPDDFRFFVDVMHRNGIGVLLDWVPAHFPKDAHGLYEFDGSPLYEYEDQQRREHPAWGTCYFDLGRNEVQCFLISNALFWLRSYHVDGLRVDAVAAMLYLDFDRAPGTWTPNASGGNSNPEAIAFFQKLNQAVSGEFPDVVMIAEESTAWPMITKPLDQGGLGFHFKWNMGWAHDLFGYLRTDPLFRSGIHHALTFPLMYAFSENYILPISHDEVVCGKKSLIDKIYGDYDDRFATMRTFLLYMMTIPGKKLMFMGTEYAQFREWDYANSLEWFMLRYPRHAEMQRYVRELNHFYLAHGQLWEIDDGWDGFGWIDADNEEMSVYAYYRRDTSGHELVVILNFAPVKRENYRLSVSKRGWYREVMNTDSTEYGGGGTANLPMRTISQVMKDGDRENVLSLTIPPLGALILEKYMPSRESSGKGSMSLGE